MSGIRFDLPESVQAIISLLNAHKELWNLSLEQKGDSTFLLDGDQVIFFTSLDNEMKTFLAGAFLATYNGKELSQISRENADGEINKER